MYRHSSDFRPRASERETKRERRTRHGSATGASAAPAEPAIRLKKGLGQHLLVSRPAARRIVEALGASPGDTAVEIGPGLGALTSILLESGLSVVAIERDPAMADELERRYLGPGAPRLAPGGLTLVRADVLTTSLAELADARGVARLFVIGNIPYRITSPILHWFTGQLNRVTRGVFTVQREVAERLLAKPGGKAYGSLTLSIMRHATVERVMHLAAGAFRPPPKVKSTVVRLEPRTQPAVVVPDEAFLESVIRRSFNHRRKMLRASLTAESFWSAEAVTAAGARARIELSRRPEELSLAEFGRLATALWELTR